MASADNLEGPGLHPGGAGVNGPNASLDLRIPGGIGIRIGRAIEAGKQLRHDFRRDAVGIEASRFRRTPEGRQSESVPTTGAASSASATGARSGVNPSASRIGLHDWRTARHVSPFSFTSLTADSAPRGIIEKA